MKRWYALLGVLVYLYVRLILIALSIRSGYRKCKQVKRGLLKTNGSAFLRFRLP